MKSHWISCKMYKMMEQSGASEGSEWGISRMMNYRWCTKHVKSPHFCTWTDEEHQTVIDFEKRMAAGDNEVVSI